MSDSGSVRALVRVVRRRKELLLLPGIATAVLGGLSWLLVWVDLKVGESVALEVGGVLVLAVLATFFSAVTLLAADDALRGRPVAIGACYARAAGRLRVIAGWAPVGALLVLGALLVVGIPLSFACYLVLPAVVLDGVGVRTALRTSRAVHRRDRGRFMQGANAMTAPVLVSVLPALVLFVVGLTATDRGLGVLLMVGAALCLGAGVTVTASLYGVFRVLLYRESTGRPVAGPVEPAGPVLHVSPVE
ncbi:hypothetical protein [Kitasatospora sp. SUK 42]|uniref:hypothetical protein n=1 Tax=Kitasatospora sp. SUK 42 TaxID=1588882 RepID=UPI0018C9E87F|nr:hypothetical protein [Kitasatospora sp. SUK 42]MBV2155590.1 hypothetical protein [Kitasatospora sp. SUK 42]